MATVYINQSNIPASLSENTTYILTENISVSDARDAIFFAFDGSGTGIIFDGSGHTITVVPVNQYYWYGLFGCPVTVRNLGLVNSDGLNYGLKPGAGWFFAPTIGGSATNCYSTGAIIAGTAGPEFGAPGGIFGQYSAGDASGCYSTGYIMSWSGGIFGFGSSGTATNCFHTTGQLSIEAGGIFGSTSSGTATKCYVADCLIYQAAGGIFSSFCTGTAINCYNTATFNVSTPDSGGIFGYSSSSGTAINCYTLYKDIFATPTPGTTTNCYAAAGTWSTTNAVSFLTGYPGDTGHAQVWYAKGQTPFRFTPFPPTIIDQTFINASTQLDLYTAYEISGNLTVTTPFIFSDGGVSTATTIDGKTAVITFPSVSDWTGLFGSAVSVQNIGIDGTTSTVSAGSGWLFGSGLTAPSATNCYSRSSAASLFGSTTNAFATNCYSVGAPLFANNTTNASVIHCFSVNSTASLVGDSSTFTNTSSGARTAWLDASANQFLTDIGQVWYSWGANTPYYLTVIPVIALPLSLTATPGNTVVLLQWTVTPTSAASTTYNVYEAIGGGAYTLTTTTTSTSITMSGLTNGTTYNFSVRAIYPGGALSDPVTASATPVYGHPLIISDQTYLYTGNQSARTVSVFDARQQSTTPIQTLSGLFPLSLAAANGKVYIVNAGTPLVTVYDASSAVVTTVALPETPLTNTAFALGVGNYVYVTQSDSIAQIDSAGAVTTVSTGTTPSYIVAAVVNDVNYIFVYTVADLLITRFNNSVPGSLSSPVSLGSTEVTTSSSMFAVFSNNVTILDNDANQQIGFSAVDPHEIVATNPLSGRPNNIYTLNNFGYTSVADGNLYYYSFIIGPTLISIGPNANYVTGVGTNLYVSNDVSNNISVIDTSQDPIVITNTIPLTYRSVGLASTAYWLYSLDSSGSTIEQFVINPMTPPTDISANPTNTTVVVSWTAATSSPTGYVVYVSGDGGTTYTVGATTTGTSVSVLNLNNGTLYYFKVKSQLDNIVFSNFSAIVSATPSQSAADIYNMNVAANAYVATPANVTTDLSNPTNRSFNLAASLIAGTRSSPVYAAIGASTIAGSITPITNANATTMMTILSFNSVLPMNVAIPDGSNRIPLLTSPTGSYYVPISKNTVGQYFFGNTADYIYSDGTGNQYYNATSGAPLAVNQVFSLTSGAAFVVSFLGSIVVYGRTVICFLGQAPVATPMGPRRIDSLKEGDLVLTDTGKPVAIQRVSKMRVRPGLFTNPYVIPKGMFGATEELLISPRHRVATAEGEMIEAHELGLQQRPMHKEFNYYNLELPGWSNMRVAGVEVESLAPSKRFIATIAQAKEAFSKLPKTAETLKIIQRICKRNPDGTVTIYGAIGVSP